MSDDRLTQTVEAIYAAGSDGGQWVEALTMVADFFGAAGATLEIFEKPTWKVVDFHMARLPEGSEVAYLQHYAVNNPRVAYAVQHLSETTLCDYQIIDERAMDRDAYYVKYLKPSGLRYFLSGQILNTPTAQGIVSIQRTRRQGHVDQKQVEWMQRLAPHFRRSHDMATRLKAAGAARSDLERALDMLVDGVALLDRSSRIVHANAAFSAIARRNDGIRAARGRIELATRAARDRLAAALAEILSGDVLRDRAAVDFSVARQADLPGYLISVRPLATRQGAGSAAAIVFVRDPLALQDQTVRSLRDSFDLTEAESSLALALQAGASPRDYARARGLSPHTVYSHLRRIKEKTGASHLPDVIHRLSSVRSAMPPVAGWP